MTADRLGVNCSCTPLSSFLQSSVQQEKEEESEDEDEKDEDAKECRLFDLKCLRLKRTQGLTQDREQQLWVFPAQWGSVSVWGSSLQAELTFIYTYHSFSI